MAASHMYYQRVAGMAASHMYYQRVTRMAASNRASHDF